MGPHRGQDATVAAATPEVSRGQVLAYRVAAQGLDRTVDDPADLGPMDLGFQDSPAGSAVAAAAARVPDATTTLDDGRRWASTWTLRGAPHIHRRGDLPDLAAALWPLHTDDAIGRLAGNGAQMKEAGADALAILRATAEALAEVADHRMTKGEASEAVTPLIPEDGVTWCRPCDSHHLGDQLMRLAALPAGLRLVPGAKPATLEPIPGWDGPPDRTEGLDRLVLAHLRSHGPARRRDVAAYFDVAGSTIDEAWPDEAAEVSVDGRSAWIAADALDGLLDAHPLRLTRLLPRSDPWLSARDRELVVLDKARRKEVWKILGSPGAVLVDGEVVGTWRARNRGKALTVAVEPFEALPRRVRRELDDEAQRLAVVRGAETVSIEVGST